MRNRSTPLSLASSLVGLTVFALVNGRVIPAPFALPGLGVAILAALAGVVFGHLGFAARRRAGSGGALALGDLLLSYVLLAVMALYTALLILAIRNFS